jgi:hypothetical protein
MVTPVLDMHVREAQATSRAISAGQGPVDVAAVAPLAVADPVCPNGRVMEQGRALSGRVPLGKPFEGVEQDVVGERHLIRRKVAFEHAPVWAKLLNAVRHQGGH